MKKWLLLLVLLAGCLWSQLALAGVYAYVPNSGDGTVSVIDTATNTEILPRISVGSNPIGVAASPDGLRVYVPNFDDNTVSVIDTMTNTVVGGPIAVGTQPAGAAVTPDNLWLYVANTNYDNFPANGTISVINTATRTAVGSPIGVGKVPVGVAVRPDGKKVYVANINHSDDNPPITWDYGTVSVIDTATNTVTKTITVGYYPALLAVSPDGTKVFVGNAFSGTVSVINTATEVVDMTITVGGHPEGIVPVVRPGGLKLYVTDPMDDIVSVIDAATGVVDATILVGPNPQGIDVTPDGTRVYAVNTADGTVSVIDTATNLVIDTVGVGDVSEAVGKFITTQGKTLCATLTAFDTDLYAFEAAQGEKVTVTLAKDAQGTSRGNVAGLSLSPVRNTYLLSDRGALPNTIQKTVSFAGTYIVKATNLFMFFDRFMGDYCVTLQSDGNAFSTFRRW